MKGAFLMNIKKSKVICIILLNMLDAELSSLIDHELYDSGENTNHELVSSLIKVLDDVDEAVEVLYEDVI